MNTHLNTFPDGKPCPFLSVQTLVRIWGWEMALWIWITAPRNLPWFGAVTDPPEGRWKAWVGSGGWRWFLIVPNPTNTMQSLLPLLFTSFLCEAPALAEGTEGPPEGPLPLSPSFVITVLGARWAQLGWHCWASGKKGDRQSGPQRQSSHG